MNKEEITTEDLAKHIQTMIDDMEQRMAAMVGMELYKQKEGFTQEQLYLYGGRIDSVFTLTFRERSNAQKKFGDEVTVCFIYTRDERKALEEDPASLNSHACVKAKLLVPYGKQYESVAKELSESGIETKDIVQALVLPPNDKNNTYPSKEKRTPKVLEIPFKAEGKGRDIGWMYGFLKRLKDRGIGLMPEDLSSYLAFKYILEPEEITIEEKQSLFGEDGQIKDAVLFHILLWRQDAEIITDEEKVKLRELKKRRFDGRMALLKQELQKQGLNLERLRKEYPQQAILILEKVISFNDRSFNTSGRFPLYMDFESLLHIYFRHAEEMNVGTQFADRDKFQLEEKDILAVIRIVMGALNEEYQAYKEQHPEGRFFRSGKMAYYYNGDYYHVNVDADGRISTFYKGSGEKR